MGKLNGPLDVDKLFEESKKYISKHPEKYRKFDKDMLEKLSNIKKEQQKTEPVHAVNHEEASLNSIIYIDGDKVKLDDCFVVDNDNNVWLKDKPNTEIEAIIFCDRGCLYMNTNEFKVFIPYFCKLDAYNDIMNQLHEIESFSIRHLLCGDVGGYIVPTNNYLYNYVTEDNGFYEKHNLTGRDTVKIIGNIYIATLSAQLMTAFYTLTEDGFANFIEELSDLGDPLYMMSKLFEDQFDQLAKLIKHLCEAKFNNEEEKK